MRHIRQCVRCGAGISGAKQYCGPCADVARTEAKAKQNQKRPAAAPLPEGAIRYVGTRHGMMVVRQ